MTLPAPPSAERASETAVARYGSTAGSIASQCSQISSGLPAVPNELERVARAWSCALASAGSANSASDRAAGSTAEMTLAFNADDMIA